MLAPQQAQDVSAVVSKVASLYFASNSGRALAMLRGHLQTREAARPRHLAWYVLRRWYGFSWHELGYAFCRDHKTAVNAVQGIERELRAGTNGARAEVDALATQLGVHSLVERKQGHAEST